MKFFKSAMWCCRCCEYTEDTKNCPENGEMSENHEMSLSSYNGDEHRLDFMNDVIQLNDP